MLYKRPMFKMGGKPTGIETLTPRVKAQTGFPGFQFLEPGLQQELRSQMKPPSGQGLTKGSRSARLLTQLRNLSIPGASTAGLMSLPFAPTAAMAYLNRPKTVEALKFMKDAPDFTFDETNLDVGDFYKELSKKNKEGKPISFLDAFLLDPETGTYPKFAGRVEDQEKRIEAEKAKNDLKKFNELALPDAKDEAKVKFSDIAEEIIPNGKKIIKDDPSDTDKDPFQTEYDKQTARLEKYLGTNKQEEKGRIAIAISDAVGTPGTLADKAAVLNQRLLGIAAGRKKDKKDLAKLAYAATVDLEKANIMAGKKSFEERRYEKLFDSAEIIRNSDKYSKQEVTAAKSYLQNTADIQSLLKDKKGDFTLTGSTLVGLVDNIPKTQKKLAKEKAKGADADPTKIARYEKELAIADAILSKDLEAIRAAVALKEGGRVNLAESFPGTVGEAAETQKTPTANVDRLDFNALRTRLPKEISDDVVRLLANDDEALQDFAYIKTQGDVNTFNLKYGVTLVLPPQAV